jgi:hypothetical protein
MEVADDPTKSKELERQGLGKPVLKPHLSEEVQNEIVRIQSAAEFGVSFR